MKKLWIGIGCYCLTMFSAYAQNENYQLFLQSGDFTPQIITTQRLIVPYVQTHADYKIIQFEKLPTEQQREKLKLAGINLLGYVPNNAFFASIQPRTNLSSLELRSLSIRAIVEIQPFYKIKPNLLEKPLPVWAVNKEGTVDVVVSVFQDYQGNEAVEKLNQLGEVLQKSERNDFFTIRVQEDNIEEIANLYFVSYIEAVTPQAQAEERENDVSENDDAVATQRSNTLKSNGLNFDGTGVTVSIGDTDIPETSHVDFETRLVIKSASSERGKSHATHCTGILGGAGNLDGQYEGQASGATILGYNGTSDYSSSNINNNFNTLKLRVTSHSLGWTCNGGYDSQARFVDQQAVTYDGLLHVYSAGNSGSKNCGQYPTGWGNITGGAKQGKNVLAIANTTVKDALSSSSSRGPAADGRIKPDVAAVGSSVYSTQANNTYASKSGTSMACPAVAGVLAQLIQAYKELNGGKYPQGGLLKGTLLNTADDKGNIGPDFKYGWGRVNALKAYKLLKDKRYTSGTISNGQKKSHTFSIPANVKEAKVMVYWMDAAASSGVSKALVNDLDIKINGNGGNYSPWVLSVSNTSTTTLNTPAKKGADHRNNMEQVSINNPSAGTYTINIDGYSIPQGSQEYFVLYEYVYNDITVTYPMGGEGWKSGDTEYIRWDAQGTTGSFKIEYSTNNGTSWSTLSSAVSGTSRYYAWSIPSSLKTANALVRVSRNNVSDESDASFAVISTPTNLSVDWVCDNVYQASWSAVSGAESYTIYQLGQTHMDSIGTTIGTSFIIPSPSTKSEYYSVSANIGSLTGRRAVSKVKNKGKTTDCPGGKDIALTNVISPSTTACLEGGAKVDVSVNVANKGTQIISSYTLNYQLDNDTKVVQKITESLAIGKTKTFTFSEKLTLPLNGNHKLKIWVETTGDLSLVNNEQEVPVYFGLPYQFKITFDEYPEDITWTLSKEGVTIDQVTDYSKEADYSTKTHDFCLAKACYDFEINDAYKDGLLDSATYSLENLTTKEIVLQKADDFTISATHDFCVEEIITDVFSLTNQLKVYPNPVKDQLFVISSEFATATLIDVLGNQLMKKEGNEMQFDVQGLSSGVYFIKVTTNQEQQTIQIFIE